MKRSLLLLTITALTAFANVAKAQDGKTSKDLKEISDAHLKGIATLPSDSLKPWVWGSTVSLNVSQVALVNWAGGGSNSVAINGVGAIYAHFDKNKLVWDVRLDLAYGTQKVGKTPFRKSDDQIIFNSLLGYKFHKGWQAGMLNNFRSQFANGFDYPTDSTRTQVSASFAPMYVVASLGVQYEAPKFFKIFVSPITSKTTIVTSHDIDHAKYGVDSNKNHFQALGAYATATFQADIFKNVNFFTKVDLFSDYMKNPQNVSVIWDTKLSLKVNTFLQVALSTNLIYDDNILVPKTRADGTIYQGKGTQFKENLAISVGYIFDSKNPPKRKKKGGPGIQEGTQVK